MIILAWWSWLSGAGRCDVLNTHGGPVLTWPSTRRLDPLHNKHKHILTLPVWYYYIFRIYCWCKISIVCPESDSRITNIRYSVCELQKQNPLYLISFYPCNFNVFAVCHLTLSWRTLGAGSWIQSTSMPLISIFCIPFWYIHLPNNIGLNFNSCS